MGTGHRAGWALPLMAAAALSGCGGGGAATATGAGASCAGPLLLASAPAQPRPAASAVTVSPGQELQLHGYWFQTCHDTNHQPASRPFQHIAIILVQGSTRRVLADVSAHQPGGTFGITVRLPATLHPGDATLRTSLRMAAPLRLRVRAPRAAPAPGYGPGHPITGRLAGTLPTFIPAAGHVVALTFDAGANDAGVPSILRTLRRFHAAATFFMTGRFARTYPAVAREIAAAGFRLGNHTMTHPYLTHLSNAGVRRQILAAAHAITAVTGENPAPLFRFPYGDQNARTIAIANRLGYVTVSWTVDTLGWEGASAGITVSEVAARVLAALRPGEIVLMHVGSSPDGSTLDAHALPRVISELRARGYSFVTLAALVG